MSDIENCLFCQIVEGSLPSRKVYEDEHILAFHDIQPSAPVHVLIIPKKHIASMNDVGGDDYSLLIDIHRVAQQIAGELGVKASGYRLVNNCGKEGGQVIYHLHYHLIGGKQLGAL